MNEYPLNEAEELGYDDSEFMDQPDESWRCSRCDVEEWGYLALGHQCPDGELGFFVDEDEEEFTWQGD